MPPYRAKAFILSFGCFTWVLLAAGCASSPKSVSAGTGQTRSTSSTSELCISLDSTPCPHSSAVSVVAVVAATTTSSQMADLTNSILNQLLHASPPVVGAVVQPNYPAHEVVVSWNNSTPTQAQLSFVVGVLHQSPHVISVDSHTQ